MKKSITIFKNSAKLVLIVLLGLSQQMFAQITYTSGAQTQSNLTASTPYGQGTVNQRIMRLQITTGGTAGTDLTINDLTVSITNPEFISRVAVYKADGTSGTGLTIPNLGLMCGEVLNPTALQLIPFTANNTIATATANNYYWVTIDIKSDATIDATVDALITGITAGTVAQAEPTATTVTYIAEVKAPLTGIKIVKNTGGDYASLNEVYTAVNTYGVGTGGVEFAFQDDETFTNTLTSAPFNYTYSIRQSGSAGSPLIIRRSGDGTNKPILNSVGTAFATDRMLCIFGSNYCIVDGLDFRTASTTLEYGILCLPRKYVGMSNSEIKNCNVAMAAGSATIRTNGILFTSTNTSGGNFRLIKIHHNTISNVDAAIAFNPQGPTINYPDEEIEVYNNTITGFFSKESGGIHLYRCYNSKIYNNVLDGTGYQLTYTGTSNAISANALTGTMECYGNIIKNIQSTASVSGFTIAGINIVAPTVKIYNNMIVGMKNETSTAGGQVVGIYCQTNTTINPTYKIWNNSIYINQTTPTGGASTLALRLDGNQSITSIELKNNIFINASTGPNVRLIYGQYVSKAKVEATTDKNLYYPEFTNFIQFSTGGYATLAAYKTGMSTIDQGAISEMPSFVSATDLHLANGGNLANAGVAVTEVTTDIDGENRAANPYIGADEIVGGTTEIARNNENSVVIRVQDQKILADLSNLQGNIVLSIIDTKGTTLKKLQYNSGQAAIVDFPGKGLFLIRIQNEKADITKKIILL